MNASVRMTETLLPRSLSSLRERPSSPRSEGIYGSLPRALKTELKVKQVEEGEDERVMKERMELVGSKSPTELGTVTSFSDIPVPNFKSILPERK